MFLPVFILAAASLVMLARSKSRKLRLALLLIWAVGIAGYVHGTHRARIALARAQARTSRAVIAVPGWIDDRFGIVRAVEITSRAEITTLFNALELQPNPVFTVRACACTGNPYIYLFDGETQFATITVHHGKSVRSTLWATCNVDIRPGRIPELEAFMHSHGVELPE